MGLDMYLTKKTYVGAKYKHRKVKGTVNITSVGYWRKANQIHKWFVENIQDGNDDCGEYEVSKEKVVELLGICKKIKENCKLRKGRVKNGQIANAETNGKFVDVIEDGKIMQNSHIAAQLLPSTSGFFFGSTDYDQYYMQDIDDTIEILEAVIAQSDPSKEYFEFDLMYSSSW